MSGSARTDVIGLQEWEDPVLLEFLGDIRRVKTVDEVTTRGEDGRDSCRDEEEGRRE